MELNIGIVGAGDFAHFAASAFKNIPGINIIAITDIKPVPGEQMARDLGATPYTDYDQFLENPKIDLVYIATPPYLHYEQSKKALLAGKHVISEKPAALNGFEAEELADLANSLRLLYVVNLMQRYNPLFRMVKEIIENKIFGEFLHGFFENYASDEKLFAGHWFWDQKKSGGIFIEHAVHFFDLFSGWLGEGKMISACQLKRAAIDPCITDRVQATVLYAGGLVNFYHGFDQPGILDRQEMRIQFERGEVTLFGWVPVKMRLYGILKKGQLTQLREWMGDSSIIRHGPSADKEWQARGRFEDLQFTDHISMEFGEGIDKQDRYRQMLGDMILDQWKWIADRNHVRIVDARNAVGSLKMAEAAVKISEII